MSDPVIPAGTDGATAARRMWTLFETVHVISYFGPHALGAFEAAIAGLPAIVLYAGVVEAGLYQVNAVVPSGIATGDAVPVVLSVAGQTSPSVTMAVK